MDNFDTVYFRHLYKEINSTEYKLSNDGLNVAWKIFEHQNGIEYKYYNWPFIEDTRPLQH